MKKQDEGGANQKRGLAVPALGDVADEEERFFPLRPLVEPVAETLVDELRDDLRTSLPEKAHDKRSLMREFLSACDARADGRREAVASKRAHADSESALCQVRGVVFSFRRRLPFLSLHHRRVPCVSGLCGSGRGSHLCAPVSAE